MIIIVGAGLSGLLTAYHLKKAGVSYKILEARPRVGGRIHTRYDVVNTPIEMGATWFTGQHRLLLALLKELEIAYYEQHMEGKACYQPSASAPPEFIQIPKQPPSYRIFGGSINLINTLYQAIGEKHVLLNQDVKEIRLLKNTVQVIAEEAFEADNVVIALPPKLWAKRITFEPALPTNLIETAQETHTWMEDSIKVAITYEAPFWKEKSLSGALFSNDGPITEFYDHCDEQRTKYALCGFVNSTFEQLSTADRKAYVMQQLHDVFGEQAATYLDYEECCWSKEKHTFEPSDQGHLPHQNNGHPLFRTLLFNDRLILSNTETAASFPGYMEGAVYAAKQAAEKILAHN